MNQIEGLMEYVKSLPYRNALGLPENLVESYEFLARGEYNVNYCFIHPRTSRKMVLRINTGSQMHLEKQIEYEYHALELLAQSGRTPRPIYVDGSKRVLPYGVLVMEFMEGSPLRLAPEYLKAAEVLADIHSVDIRQKRHQLLHPKNPLSAIFKECEEMIQVYYQSSLADKTIKNHIQKLMDLGKEKVQESDWKVPYECCINTEVNSTNFLVSKNGASLVDWEKPLFGDPAQDIGHFLAPTTTFWKSDVILNAKEVDTFLIKYLEAVNQRFDTTGIEERIKAFIPITCLRGITWCAMAWVEYQDDKKLIRNESTWKKLNQYLDLEFLTTIHKERLM